MRLGFAALGPIAVGGISAAAIGVPTWDASKQALLVSMSVIAAGVLVRLARGLPFTNADQFTVEEIRKLTAAMDRILRSLRLLVIIVLATMVFLVIANPLDGYLNSNVPRVWSISTRVTSGISGALISYIFIRMFQVIQGDYDLSKLQAKILIQSVERRQAADFERQEAASSSSGSGSFRNPSSYGRIVQ